MRLAIAGWVEVETAAVAWKHCTKAIDTIQDVAARAEVSTEWVLIAVMKVYKRLF